MTHDEALARVTRHFAGEALPGLEQQALRAHLRGCPPCRAYFDAATETESLLGPHAAGERMAREAPHWRPASSPKRLARVAAVTLALAAAGVAVVALRPEAPGLGTDLQARGGGGTVPARVRLYVRRGETTAALGESLGPDDALMLSYTNGRESPMRSMAVAARDAAGRVHWLWPAWDVPGEDVHSLDIDAGVADVPLPSAVTLRAAAGPMEICALFSREPLSVPVLDAGLERGEPWPSESETLRRSCRSVVVRP